ncbi:MAG: hypothetical protein IJ326_01760 [Lachnospiraceae bacterium]|nr:hypothetical protein [Lachnospiraceae bacterium]
MANIQWTSSSISSFFNTSLNQNTTGFNGLYSLLGDASLIRSGSYYKLMDAYYKNVKNQTTESTSETTESSKTTSDTEETKTSATEETKKEEIWDKIKTDTTLSSAYTNTGKATTNLDTSSILDTIV